MVLSQEIKDALNDEMDFVKCPACGYDDADSSRGVKMHYSYADDDTHPDKLPKYIFRCVQCGEVDEGSNAEQLYCSRDCRTLDEVATLKHKDEDFLRKKIEDEGVRVYEIAKEIGVDSDAVYPWVRKYDIGNDYPCPKDGCEESFATRQGVSKHHEDKHQESIRGENYICSWCSKENWTPRTPVDPKFPKYCDDGCFGSSMEGENNPNKDEVRKKKIAEGITQAYKEGRKKPRGRAQIHVQETGHVVDSGWEEEIDLMLHDMNVEYIYNQHPDFPYFDLGEYIYTPDFNVGDDIIVEVKGVGYVYNPEKTVEIAEKMTAKDEIKYVVYGNEELPADEFVEYGNEEELREVINNISNPQKENGIWGY